MTENDNKQSIESILEGIKVEKKPPVESDGESIEDILEGIKENFVPDKKPDEEIVKQDIPESKPTEIILKNVTSPINFNAPHTIHYTNNKEIITFRPQEDSVAKPKKDSVAKPQNDLVKEPMKVSYTLVPKQKDSSDVDYTFKLVSSFDTNKPTLLSDKDDKPKPIFSFERPEKSESVINGYQLSGKPGTVLSYAVKNNKTGEMEVVELRPVEGKKAYTITIPKAKEYNLSGESGKGLSISVLNNKTGKMEDPIFQPFHGKIPYTIAKSEAETHETGLCKISDLLDKHWDMISDQISGRTENRALFESENRIKSYLNNLSYSTQDVELFVKENMLKFYEKNDAFTKLGLYISFLINNLSGSKTFKLDLGKGFFYSSPHYHGFHNSSHNLIINDIPNSLYVGHSMCGGSIHVKGGAGNVGQYMNAGLIEVDSDVKNGSGWGMTGGEIIIHGNAGGATGVMMSGGKITIHGSEVRELGAGMTGGEIIIHGNAGWGVGNNMTGGEIYLNGNYTSLGEICGNGCVYHKGRKIS